MPGRRRRWGKCGEGIRERCLGADEPAVAKAMAGKRRGAEKIKRQRGSHPSALLRASAGLPLQVCGGDYGGAGIGEIFAY